MLFGHEGELKRDTAAHSTTTPGDTGRRHAPLKSETQSSQQYETCPRRERGEDASSIDNRHFVTFQLSSATPDAAGGGRARALIEIVNTIPYNI
ncbi:hypothetical protein AVEN_267806-1 [Araneus ventricosus]|uniref:Uncharacterized protein n=1 Tax=Araneus ventricosus TaxID=182803 RepID=A0A4Y2D3G1_ARAVE|nr:hypothetical protein AVEN_267806-1 [Araneus ventricosus]